MATLLVVAMIGLTGGATASAATTRTFRQERVAAPVELAPISDEAAEKFLKDTGGSGSVRLRTGGEIRIAPVDDAPAEEGMVKAQFSVGIGWGIYIYLTPREQRAILTGTVAGLTTAICRNAAVVNAIGVVGCAAAVGTALWLAKDWLEEHRVCSHRLEVKVGSGFKCV